MPAARHRAFVWPIVVLLTLLAWSIGPASATAATSPTGIGPRTACVYASDHISMLDTFGALVGRSFQCAMVYNDASPDWAGWEHPWFIGQTYTDMEWGAWASAPGTHRQLIITQNLFPASEDRSNWLRMGARGAFEAHARELARNLVRAGLGHAVVRLAHEANGNWYPDSIPDTPSGDRLWVKFWRNTVIAMRSVAGAHFQFDWTVNAGYRNVPLRSFYPGNDVVNIIGIDAYDAGVPAGKPRWATVYGQPDGIAAVASFAAAHRKPLSIPEWGIGPALKPGWGAAGDDPAYVDGIAWVVAHDDVAYQCYFDADEVGMQFFNSPLSIAAYRNGFGVLGDAPVATTSEAGIEPGSASPAVNIDRGPADGSIVNRRTVTFGFTAQHGHSYCQLDGGSWTRCSASGRETFRGLAKGYHWWQVKVTDAYDRTAIRGRSFLVT